MSKLLRKQENQKISDEVTLVHNVTEDNSPLKHVEFKTIDLIKGGKYKEELAKKEVCVVALTGKITVTDGEKTFDNLGRRADVFEKVPTDSVYISNDRTFEIEGESDARVVLCYSHSEKQLPTTLIKAEDNVTEDRGKYSNKRHVNNILTDSDDIANNLLVVEVFTESGNWSSYPPHKHDQDNLPEESFLEETYYHEMNPKQGFVFQRVYTDDRSIDETMTVENGNVVLVPAGYHPVGVPDGYESYYLNVMAGTKRIWKFNNDPDHEWIIDRK